MYVSRECQPFSLPEAKFSQLAAKLSPARLAPYIADANSATPAQDMSLAIRRYRWNILLAEALVVPLHFSEVFVRNAIYETIRSNSGRQWLTATETMLNDETKNIIRIATNKIRATNKSKNKNQTPKAGQIIAAMTFGFWHFMTRPKYHNIFWRNTLGAHFPHSCGGTPKALHEIMTRLLNARNRLAHHEPILWHDPQQIYDDCLTLIEWIAGREILEMIDEDLSHFRHVMSARPM